MALGDTTVGSRPNCAIAFPICPLMLQKCAFRYFGPIREGVLIFQGKPARRKDGSLGQVRDGRLLQKFSFPVFRESKSN